MQNQLQETDKKLKKGRKRIKEEAGWLLQLFA